MRKALTTLLMVILIELVLCYPAFARCFLIIKNGNIRSCPSTECDIVAHVAKWKVIDLSGYNTKWEQDWLCIAKEVPIGDKKIEEIGWTPWDTELNLHHKYRIGQEAEILDLTVSGRLLGTKKGIMIRFTGKERQSGSNISKELVYQAIGQTISKQYIHHRFSRQYFPMVINVRDL